jgi:hypothetical protein
MAPGFLRKIFDKVKGLIKSSDDSNTTEQSSETSFSDTIKKGIDFVNDAANTTNEVIDYAKPMVETVQKIVKKVPKTKPKPPPQPIEEIEEYEEEIYEPPPSKPTKKHSQIKERTFTNYQPVAIESKPIIQDQNVKTKPKLQPILKSQKYTPVQTFSSYQSTQPQFYQDDYSQNNYSPSNNSLSRYSQNNNNNKWYDDENDDEI